MISNACATMRTAMIFLPLLRPFIINLHSVCYSLFHIPKVELNARVDETLDDRHLRLLELLLLVAAGRVGEVDSMARLDVVRQGDVLNLNTVARISVSLLHYSPIQSGTYSWVSHFPKSLTSWSSLEMSFGKVVAAILRSLEGPAVDLAGS